MPAARITLRSATADDEEFLRLVYFESRREELSAIDWPVGALEEFLRTQFDAQQVQYRATYPGALFLVAEQDGRPIGRLYYRAGESEIRLIDVALLPEMRGRGLGADLIGNLQQQARGARTPVVLHVEKHKRAIRLYRRLGFQVTSQGEVYWRMEWAPS